MHTLSPKENRKINRLFNVNDKIVFDKITYRERSNFYDSEFVIQDDHEFIRLFISKRQTQNILEIPCGSGRNIALYKRYKKNVMLVDKEASMVVQARKKIKNKERIRARVGDMLSLKFKSKFDLIISPKGGIQQLKSQKQIVQVLTNFKNHLTSNGRIIIDIALFGSTKDIYTPNYYSPGKMNIPISDWTRDIDKHKRLKRIHINEDRKHYIITHFYYSIYNRQLNRREFKYFQLRTKKYSYSKILKSTQKVGLIIDQIYSGYGFENFNPKKDYKYSRMLIILK